MRKHGSILLAALLLAAVAQSGCGGGGGGGGGSANQALAENDPAVPADSVVPLPYSVALLASPGGDCYAVAVNDAGEVTGNCRNGSGGTDAWAWRGGRMELIAPSAQAAAIGNEGGVVGWLENPAGPEAFIHDERLYYLAFPEGTAKALAVNDHGQVAGRWTSGSDKAFLEQNGLADAIAPEINGYAVALNNAGQVIVKEVLPDRFHALLWDAGTLTSLGTLGGKSTQVRGINNNGRVVGWSETGDGRAHAFLWEDGRMVDLARSPEEHSAAVAVNDRGQILIKTSSNAGDHIYLWENGAYTDLDQFEAGYAEVTDLNNNGQITGWIFAGNRFQAFVATPTALN